jgi:hypothetical protein
MYSHFPNLEILHCNGYGLPNSSEIPRLLEQIKSASSDKIIAFDKSDGPTDNELEYLDWIDTLNLNRDYIVITSNYKYHFNKHNKIVHYPHYFFKMFEDKNVIKPDIVATRPYKLSCLNRNPWIHKSINILEMKKQSWFDDVQLSYGVLYRYLMPSPITTDLELLITKEEIKYLESIYPLRLKIDNDNTSKFESNACPTYQQCYIDYAPESRHNNVFISEKTWKPIFSGQFFFILGPCGIIEYLRDIGIDVYDDLIDHSYDQEQDLVTKINLLMASITKFLNNDLDQLWVDTYNRRKKNLDLVYDPDFQQFMSADLFSRVS